MAIPFRMPREQTNEDYYVRLEQLLRDLFEVLSSLITGGAFPSSAAPPPNHHHHQQPPPPPPPSQGPSATTVNSLQISRPSRNVSYTRQNSLHQSPVPLLFTSESGLEHLPSSQTPVNISSSAHERVPFRTASELLTRRLSPQRNLTSVSYDHQTTSRGDSESSISPSTSRPDASTSRPDVSQRHNKVADDYWRNLGCELRGIADAFKASRNQPAKKMTDLKNGILSLQIRVQDGAISLVGQQET